MMLFYFRDFCKTSIKTSCMSMRINKDTVMEINKAKQEKPRTSFMHLVKKISDFFHFKTDSEQFSRVTERFDVVQAWVSNDKGIRRIK
jgi:hypothetical protein